MAVKAITRVCSCFVLVNRFLFTLSAQPCAHAAEENCLLRGQSTDVECFGRSDARGRFAPSAWSPAQARPSPRGKKAAREGMFPPGRKWYQTSRGSGRRRVRQAAFPRGASARRLVSRSPEPSGIRCRCGPRWGRRGCRFRSRPPWERPSRPPSCRRRRRGPGPCPAACRVRPGLHP